MKVAIMFMLIVITMGLWTTWIYSLKKRMGLSQITAITIAMVVMTPVTIFYGTYYG